MKSADELRYEWLPKEIQPSSSRQCPAFWIRDLVLLSSLSDPSKNVIRNFRLRRGLNILWAKPFQPDGAENSGESFAGHAAGKTLFCRMIRYLLGERHLGNEIVQARVAGGFPDGWVIGTIFIEDTPWLVGRPFASKHGQFAVQGKTAEDFLEGRVEERPHYDAFQDALHRRVTRDHRLREFPDKGGRIDIQHLLPWFTRDQEARYGSASGWREAASGAEPMATDNEDRHFLMRVVLNLIHPNEIPELDRNAKLLRQLNDHKAKQPVLKDRAKTDFKRLRDELDAVGFDPEFVQKLTLDDDLLSDSVEAKLEEELTRLRGLIQEIPTAEDVKALQAQLTLATEKRVELQRDVRDVEKLLTDKQTDWGNFQNKGSIEELKAHQRTMEMPTGYCGAPISVAKNHTPRCNLWREFSNLPNEEGCDAENLEALNIKFAEEVKSLEAKLEEKRENAQLAVKAESDASRALTEANEQRSKVFAFLSAKKVKFDGLKTLAEQAIEAHRASKQAEIDQKSSEKKLKESYEIQQTIRAQQDGVRNVFISYFDAVCKHVLGSKVRAAITIERRSLVLETFDRGPLTSAAIETVKILALDFAALWSSIEDKSFHPGFLMHDGPREADMDAWMYRRFFTFMRKLEEAYPADQEPAFQYIITTTEAPPDDMQGDRWLLPPLSARTQNERLLRTDLS
jgi:hypothetical protein